MSGNLERALAALELLAAAPAGLPLHAVTAALRVPKSAAHRVLAALAGRGYVRQDEVSSHYLLTTRLVSLAFRHLAVSGVVDTVQPTLDDLARRSGELVRLGVIDGDRQTWVAKAQGARTGLKYDADMGQEAPLASTASGHAWLALLPDERAVALVLAQGFPPAGPVGPNAPATLPDLLARLDATRLRGYARVSESSAPGTAAMAAAVRHPGTGGVIGVVSIAGPSVRLTEARMDELAEALHAAASALADACSTSDYFTAASRAVPAAATPRPASGAA